MGRFTKVGADVVQDGNYDWHQTGIFKLFDNETKIIIRNNTLSVPICHTHLLAFLFFNSFNVLQLTIVTTCVTHEA